MITKKGYTVLLSEKEYMDYINVYIEHVDYLDSQPPSKYPCLVFIINSSGHNILKFRYKENILHELEAIEEGIYQKNYIQNRKE